jgi:hypothetical protein
MRFWTIETVPKAIARGVGKRMNDLWLFLGFCAVAQGSAAIFVRNPLLRFLLVLVAGAAAIVAYQLFAYLELGYMDAFIWIAVTIQPLIALVTGLVIFALSAIPREATEQRVR